MNRIGKTLGVFLVIVCALLLLLVGLDKSMCREIETVPQQQEIPEPSTIARERKQWSIRPYYEEDAEPVILSEEDAEVVEQFLMSDKGVDKFSNCALWGLLECEDGRKFSYSSDGAFQCYDDYKWKCLVLEEQEKKQVNQMLEKYLELRYIK